MRFNAIKRKIRRLESARKGNRSWFEGLSDEGLDALLLRLMSSEGPTTDMAIKNAQTFCDLCGGDLTKWSCYSNSVMGW